MGCTRGNLGANAQNRRLRMSILALLVGLALSTVMLRSGAPAAARLVLFFPFFAAAFGAYQGLFRTCTFAARHGLRIDDHGEEVVIDRAERDSMRGVGRRVLVGSLLTAATATLMVVLLP